MLDGVEAQLSTLLLLPLPDEETIEAMSVVTV